MRIIRVLTVLTSAILFTANAAAQATDDTSVQFKLRLTSPTPRAVDSSELIPQPPSSPSISVIDKKVAAAPVPKQRDARLSPDQIVVVAIDAHGREIYRASRHDPRIVRAEAGNDNGDLVLKKRYRQDVQFSVALPNDPRIREIRLFKPIWNGKSFQLESIGVTPID